MTMVRSKTSVYVDQGLWERLRRYSARKSSEVSRILEKMIEEEMTEDIIDVEISRIMKEKTYELSFEPIKLKRGLLSTMVREMRDERASHLSR